MLSFFKPTGASFKKGPKFREKICQLLNLTDNSQARIFLITHVLTKNSPVFLILQKPT